MGFVQLAGNSVVFLTVLPEALMLFAGLFIGQIVSAGLAARYTGKFCWSDSLIIGQIGGQV